jgi:hypothetical protein
MVAKSSTLCITLYPYCAANALLVVRRSPVSALAASSALIFQFPGIGIYEANETF